MTYSQSRIKHQVKVADLGYHFRRCADYTRRTARYAKYFGTRPCQIFECPVSLSSTVRSPTTWWRGFC